MTTSGKKLLWIALGGGALAAAALVGFRRPDEKPAAPGTTAPANVTATTTPSPVEPRLALPNVEPKPSDAAGAASGEAMDLGTAISQTNKLAEARTALAGGDAQRALAQIAEYENFPAPLLLKEEATVLKIQALAKAGRRTDALSLAMSTRDDPSYGPYQQQIESIVSDAGLRQP